MDRRPSWLKVRAHAHAEASGMRTIRDLLDKHQLTTVCQGARCPNAAECWEQKTATFMLLGEMCTRACLFCAVPTGNPKGVVDRGEPARLASAIADLGLRYVVLTSVDRDDLADGGASLFAAAISGIRTLSPGIRIEALIPDFAGNEEALAALVASGPDVVGHNIETVRRLSPGLRDPRAGHDLSLRVLERIKEMSPHVITKSSIMLGLGEKREEVLDAMRELRLVGVDALTLGQYLAPTDASALVTRYLSPEEFATFEEDARNIGFRFVMSGPLVRSSYRAAQTITACSA